MRRIGVIGIGVVGSAVMTGFRERGFKVYTYDKHKAEHDDFPYIMDTDAIFVCVPTPTVYGRQDLTALDEVFAMLKAQSYSGVIVVKSTVLPGTTDAMAEKFGFRRVVHNPEFLTAANPLDDFREQVAIIIGGKDLSSVIEVGEIYHEAKFPASIKMYPDAKVTEIAKYMRNNYLAMKVTYFNEIAELCEFEGVEYDLALKAMLSMGGIEETHTKVPGPDGEPGFGGMCFPKDTQALVAHAREHGLKMDVLEATVEGNNRRRGVK